MNRTKKIAGGLFIIVIIALAAVFLYVHSIARQGLPDYNTSVVIPGMKEKVTVYRDRFAVPHIYAKNQEDLYRAVGYCMAQDRLWQMDLLRRVTTGRLSEIFGEDMVETDLLMRSLRITEKSVKVITVSDHQMIAALRAFSDGVNQYMESHTDSLPVEFSILGYKPEPWEIEHSVNLIGYMAWDLTMPWKTEMALYKISQKVNEERMKDLVPQVKDFKTYVYPYFAKTETEISVRRNLLQQANALQELGVQIFSGSNNWAVAGWKSETGKPLLANDMHLGLFAPGIWYQMHQVIEGELDVTGVVLPGQPCVIAGHNDRIAWGMTNVMVDDMDFYREKVNPDNENEYMFNGKWRRMQVREEEIATGNGNVLKRKIRFTHRGPVVSGMKDLEDEVISMHWIGNDFSNELRSVYLLNRAKNWNDFRNAARSFLSVSQNIVYADVDGNIGMYCCAGIPIREGNGIEIMPGDTDRYDWKGFVPFERRPHSFNPTEGFVASANNKTVSDRYPFYISYWFDQPHRIDRIREMLSEKQKYSVDDFNRMQLDQRSKLVEQMKGDIVAIAGNGGLSSRQQDALNRLSEWKGIMSGDSGAAAIFEAFYIKFMRNCFYDEMGDKLFDAFTTKTIMPKNAIDAIWKKKSSPWCDDVNTADVTENFNDMVQQSFKEAVEWLDDEMGGGPQGWKWKDIHALTLKHPMGGVWILDLLFNLNSETFPVGGSFHTVSPYSYSFRNPFVVTAGSSHRHIYSTADWNMSRSIIPTGSSGIPASEHYCDQSEQYVKGISHPDHVRRDLVEKNARYTMEINGK